MALDGTKTLKPSNLDIFTANVGTELPADLTKIPAAWVNSGHSSLDDILTFQTEGGETTTLGSIQNPALRQSTSAAVRSIVVNLLQWDSPTLAFYYGSNATVTGNKVSIPEVPVPAEKAVLIVIHDGTNRFAIYAPKASLIGNGDVSLTDTSSLAQLPIRITPLSHSGKNPMELVTF